MSFDLSKTPKFERPPVVETVLGVQFQPLVSLKTTHFGSFHELLKTRGFESTQDQPRLDHTVEQKQSNVRFLPPPFLMPWAIQPRVWFLTPETAQGQILIQLQNDRLVQNWRRGNLNDVSYTSYTTNREQFSKTLELFLQFAGNNALGSPIPDQCELMYLSSIPLSDFDNDQTEAFKACFNVQLSTDTLAASGSKMEKAQIGCSFWSELIRGRLHIEIGSSSIVGTAGDAINVSLTARGAPETAEMASLLKWMDLAHYLVVNTFTDITTKQMHEKWGLKK